MAPVAVNSYAGICGWTREAAASSAPHPTKGMTAGCRCIVGAVRSAL
jgi:hypothetical protein